MKRVFSGIMVLLLAASLALSGCSAKTTDGPEKAPPQKPGANLPGETPDQPEVHVVPDYLSENKIDNGIVTIHLPADWDVESQGRFMATDPELKCVIVAEFPLSLNLSIGNNAEAFDNSFFPGVYKGLEGQGFVFPDGHERVTVGNVVYEKSLFSAEMAGSSLKGYIMVCRDDSDFYVIECFAKEPYYTDYAQTIQDIVDNIEFSQK